jgi:hypothetical protein
MIRPMRSLCALLLALAVTAPAAATTTGSRLSQFDVNNSQTWADALALCDLTSFLRTRPSLDADVVLTVDPLSRMDRVLYGPRFQPISLFFDTRFRRMFERLEKSGEVDRSSVAQARRRLDLPMFDEFRVASVKDMVFLEEQAELCTALTIDVRRRYP